MPGTTTTTDPRPPLISVIGATGTGKSNVAVDLALALDGEIINADAMQLYEGLPIITNKITPVEARGVTHHLLGVLGAREAWQVGRFVSEAGRIIREIHARGKVPVLVGGTHYYVQSLLHPTTLADTSQSADTAEPPVEELAARYPILSETTPTAALHAHLAEIDPAIAAHWHPNDRRKILRSLCIYYASGRTPSALYAAQPAPVSPYRNIVFWVHAETETLRARLDARVDGMLQRGMGAEIEEMKELWDRAGDGVDLNSGIWQSIGFKEFLPFLQRRGELGFGVEYGIDAVLAGTPSQPAPGLEAGRELTELLMAALEGMKTATRQYAKSQVRWIRQKLLPALEGEPVYVLDSTSPTAFTAIVCPVGVSIARSFLAGDALPEPRGLGPLAEEMLGAERKERGERWGQRECQVCETVCVGEEQWRLHVRSNRHKKAVGRQKRGEVVEAWKAWEVERRRWKEGGCVGEEPVRPGAGKLRAQESPGESESEDEGEVGVAVARGSGN